MPMVEIRLSALWTAVMLTYLLGDVMRIMTGDFKPGTLPHLPGKSWVWLLSAALMLIPILMVVLTVFLPQPISRWANIIVSVPFLVSYAVQLPKFASMYDKFLVIVTLIFNVLIIWCAWRWV